MHDRLFRALLRLLPAEFRGAYANEMEATFRDERRAARGFSLLALWAATLGDLARTAPSEHWDVFVRDARFAFRGMRARKTLTAAAVITLALGIGANVAMFAVVDAVLLAPLAYQDPARVVIVQEQAAGKEAGNLGYLTFLDLQARAGAFTALAAASQSYAILAGDGRDAERVGAMRASASYFDVAGVRPALGRTFTQAEDRPGEARRVAILSDSLWRRRFGGDRSVIGRPVSLGGTAFTVVGVMPAGFSDLVAARLFEGAELWTPLGYDPAAAFACRTCRHLQVFGRLAPGIGVAQAQRDATAVLEGVAREFPREYDVPRARVETLGDFFLGPVRPVLLTLWAGVAVLLLAACANVANLLLLRASERGHEIAVRVALGVTRGRLVRQLLTESALLAALGGLVGLLPAWAALRLVAANGPAQLPRLAEAAFDARAIVVAIGLAALCSLIFGLVPLRQLKREDVAHRMHGPGRSSAGKGTWRLRAALVGGNVAVAVLLLVGAGLLVRSLTRLLAVPAGFDAGGVLTLRVDLFGPRYSADAPVEEIARVTQFYGELLSRVRALPGVTSASAVTTLPMGGGQDGFGLHLVDRPLARPEEAPDADRFAVMPGFFETLGIGLLRGRTLDERDAQGVLSVAVVNRTLAEELFAGQDPLGRQVRLGPADAEPRTIVGVVADIRHHGLHTPAGYQVYVPAPQWAWAESTMTLTVRTTGDPRGLAPSVREVVRALDVQLPVTEVQAYDDVVAASLATSRFATTLLSAFAAAALVLALVGLYGALGVLVRQREREIGLRMALGAAASQVRAMILRQGLRPVMGGLVAGLVLAALSARILGSLLYGVSAWDPRTFGGVAALLATSALGAALLPAWRASRTDPAITLRSE